MTIYPETYDMLQRRKFNPWGGGIQPTESYAFDKNDPTRFTFRYPGRNFPGNTPSVKTNITINELQNIAFPSTDERKVATLDMEIGVKDVLPTQMSGAYATDGIGNIAVKAFTPPYKVAYQYDAVATSSNGQTPAAWDTVNKSLDISASILGINTTDYLTHLIMTVFMENPNVGMWLAFTTDNSVYYKVEANVSNTQSNKRLEGQTMVIPVQHQSDLSWIPMLWIKHRNMGKFVVQLRGIIYRRGA